MTPEMMNSFPIYHTDVDPWELQLFLVELREWDLTAEHHMHKSWQFGTCQQALHWHTLAQAVSDRHGRDCLFYLGHVGSGRIETDILNPTIGHLIRDELAVAVMLNTLERQIKSQPISP
ncbi:MAG: hypothetical protein ACK52U_10095 [Synechococcaceae cyanobacterium]|jgi:hypothetical protein